MSLPLAPYPPPSITSTFPSSQWTAILQSWTLALTHLLHLPDAAFATSASGPTLPVFLLSYLTNSPAPAPDEPPYTTLKRKVFQLLHRLLHLRTPPRSLLTTADFLLVYTRTFGKAPAAVKLIEDVWARHEIAFTETLARLKADTISRIRRHELTGEDMQRLERVFATHPKVAARFLAGDDFLEGVQETGDEGAVKLLGRALLEAGRVNWSVVVECLYTLTTSGGEAAKRVLGALAGYGVGNKLKAAAEGSDAAGRVSGVAEKLQSYGAPRERGKKKRDVKGKGRASEGERESFVHEAEVEMESKVASIRDLFPQLGAGFVRRCLEAMGGDVEVVTSALLEDNLPDDLKHADREEAEYKPKPQPLAPPHAVGRIPERRNVYDNDDLDLLNPTTRSRLTVGHSNKTDTTSLSDRSELPKSAILSALSAIDLDDDERDDTYDEADVGAALEPTTEASPAAEDDEKAAWTAFKLDASTFERSARGSQGRNKLKEETGWTDEALEGFAIMLNREPDRMRRLERKYADVDVPRNAGIERTRWQAGDEETRGGFRGRGRGRGGRGGRGGAPPTGPSGRGGSAQGGSAPPGGDARTRARKEQNKGRGANHNRREGRARKVARGGFGPGPE